MLHVPNLLLLALVHSTIKKQQIWVLSSQVPSFSHHFVPQWPGDQALVTVCAGTAAAAAATAITSQLSTPTVSFSQPTFLTRVIILKLKVTLSVMAENRPQAPPKFLGRILIPSSDPSGTHDCLMTSDWHINFSFRPHLWFLSSIQMLWLSCVIPFSDPSLSPAFSCAERARRVPFVVVIHVLIASAWVLGTSAMPSLI